MNRFDYKAIIASFVFFRSPSGNTKCPGKGEALIIWHRAEHLLYTRSYHLLGILARLSEKELVCRSHWAPPSGIKDTMRTSIRA
ncbi:hypothetical protein [Porphyromonas gulae]|uniref:hypothetical protein n=1 Tax=Porphyromonas gulae TaxID=111105 RepID=UPI001269C32B|nr:hypothetical protein [Porphyromonas gulae]